MRIYCILNRRVLALLLLSTVLTILIFGQFKSYQITQKNGDTHKNRINFISNLGFSVDEDSVTEKQVFIPYSFSDVYENYNKVQLKAGYDLTKYRGENVICYSYNVISDNTEDFKVVNLLVHNGLIVGGDVSSLRIDGDMLPLVKKE